MHFFANPLSSHVIVRLICSGSAGSALWIRIRGTSVVSAGSTNASGLAWKKKVGEPRSWPLKNGEKQTCDRSGKVSQIYFWCLVTKFCFCLLSLRHRRAPQHFIKQAKRLEEPTHIELMKNNTMLLVLSAFGDQWSPKLTLDEPPFWSRDPF